MILFIIVWSVPFILVGWTHLFNTEWWKKYYKDSTAVNTKYFGHLPVLGIIVRSNEKFFTNTLWIRLIGLILLAMGLFVLIAAIIQFVAF